MDRLFNSLRPVIRGVVRFAPVVLVIALLLSYLGVRSAMNLSIDTDLANLIPDDYPSAVALERLRETVGGESEAAVGIVSPSFQANRAFAEDLIPRVLNMQDASGEPFFQRVEYRKEVKFLKDNALYFSTPEELDKLETWLESKIEDARLEANPFFFDLEDDEGAEPEPDTLAQELQAVYDDIVAKEYPVSEDSTTLVLQFIPTEASSDIAFIEDAYAAIDSAIAALNPASYHPEMTTTTAGRLLRRQVEVQTIQNDVLNSFGSGVAAVLLLVVLYFLYKSYRARAGSRLNLRVLGTQALRAPVMALLIGLPLMMSLSWTFGVAYWQYEQLNLMTSTLGLVLFGLGIDFGIHFYARYTEERAEGATVSDAAETTFTSTGQAITIGALTTSLALYVLVAADFKGFSQFGFMAGTGIIFALVSMLIVLPALIALLERTRLLNTEVRTMQSAQSSPAGSQQRFRGYRGVVITSLALVVAAIVFLPRVSFEYRFGELEPEYEEYEERREVMRRVYNDRRSRNPAYVVADSPDEIPFILEALREKMESDTLSPTISRIESLQDRFPMTDSLQQRRLARLGEIRELLNDRFLREDDSADMQRLRRAAQTREPIALDQVPEFLRKQFTAKTGELGNFVIIYPSVGLSDGRQSIAFANDVGTIEADNGVTYHAGSTSIVAADMLKLMRREAPWMVAATFVIVLLLMYINFGSLRWMMLAVIPLVVGVLWMLLIMEIVGAKLNFYNLIVLPAVLGIGNDAGVHLVHRYREEGAGSVLRVLRSTGEHVAMGSITTTVGFAGLLLSFHPGLESIGSLAVMGIGSTLLAAILFLPAMLQWLEDRDKVA